MEDLKVMEFKKELENAGISPSFADPGPLGRMLGVKPLILLSRRRVNLCLFLFLTIFWGVAMYLDGGIQFQTSTEVVILIIGSIIFGLSGVWGTTWGFKHYENKMRKAGIDIDKWRKRFDG